MDNNIQLYLPRTASDRASGRIDLQINGTTVAEWHDKLIRQECEMSGRAKEEITKAIWEHWKINSVGISLSTPVTRTYEKRKE